MLNRNLKKYLLVFDLLKASGCFIQSTHRTFNTLIHKLLISLSDLDPLLIEKMEVFIPTFKNFC
jgi:hypothetical protein